MKYTMNDIESVSSSSYNNTGILVDFKLRFHEHHKKLETLG